jgi:hypothetical protein
MSVGEILQPSGSGPSIAAMFLALLTCSDESCAHELEAWGALRELEALACDCGCALQVMAVSEVELIDPAPPPAAAYEWLPLAA